MSNFLPGIEPEHTRHDLLLGVPGPGGNCRCGHPATDVMTYWMPMADGRRQLRQDCRRCGQYLRYAPQHLLREDAPALDPEAADLVEMLRETTEGYTEDARRKAAKTLYREIVR